MAECWKPDEELSDDFAERMSCVLDDVTHHTVLYIRDEGRIKVWGFRANLVESLTKHQALDKLLGIAGSIIELLDEARIQVDKAELMDMLRSTLDSDNPPDEIDYGLIAVTKEDLESAARDMKLGHHEKAALLRRRDQISWSVANIIMTEKFMPIVIAESRNTLAEIARLN